MKNEDSGNYKVPKICLTMNVIIYLFLFLFTAQELHSSTGNFGSGVGIILYGIIGFFFIILLSGIGLTKLAFFTPNTSNVDNKTKRILMSCLLITGIIPIITIIYLIHLGNEVKRRYQEEQPGKPISRIIASLDCLTLSSTRTPPALPSALSLHSASSASFIASVQAGPVSPIR